MATTMRPLLLAATGSIAVLGTALTLRAIAATGEFAPAEETGPVPQSVPVLPQGGREARDGQGTQATHGTRNTLDALSTLSTLSTQGECGGVPVRTPPSREAPPWVPSVPARCSRSPGPTGDHGQETGEPRPARTAADRPGDHQRATGEPKHPR